MSGRYGLVVVANRLPVDLTVEDDGSTSWRRSPGGLVSALEPVMQAADGAWVGWAGSPDVEADAFDGDGMRLVPVALSADEVRDYYEGFSNDTLWPLYHDVISPPEFHRRWWDAYRRVNRRFAEAAADQAAEGATVWVQDYQLQLVPALLRDLRPDLRIGYFHHIPFPPLEIFAQLPWRRQVVEGLLGADLIGFQRAGDASNFVRVVRRLTDLSTKGQVITVPGTEETAARTVRAAAFPISIDSARFDAMARTEAVRARAREIRRDLGDPSVLLLGVDRLDYTKGIRHRIKAFGELLEEGRLAVPEAALVQVASPSRENVEAYQQLRDEVETLVGRINGEHGQIGSAAIYYMHHSYPPEEMAALYLAADVMLVTALRDGMNLVAKEFVAACTDDRGVLVLSEFAGAADELAGSLLVNPHDIDGLKDAIERAVTMEPREMRRRMRKLRRRVLEDDVTKWSRTFLDALALRPGQSPGAVMPTPQDGLADALTALVDRVHGGGSALLALDFDGVLAPLVDDPDASRPLPAAVDALATLAGVPGLHLALVSGRAVADLADKAGAPEGTRLVGSHGAERGALEGGALRREELTLDPARSALRSRIGDALDAAVEGTSARVEHKPASVVLHTRTATSDDAARLTDVALDLGRREGVDAMQGKDVVELSVLHVTKGDALADLRRELDVDTLLYAGDDVTDERAFATLRPDDLTVRVGPGSTKARFRVADPDAVADLLMSLADRLRSREP
ncbi:bifunctional alpha,alpha-trehalose-phosphate synthase (UDP-forming)/trehalose-phosphatase [Cellulomonas carbonis]|uniref:Trehalose phosphatase n=1 Tax=Cellulomonas carbonis T26 TaxID=947969 RepID=A0A0A0BTX3_9CELL|nr:bifunctional alpha,alpha-trehalose-phosphate synthase (UDP-forming)/trehalose-phosphatase [Cellulomonas carbonis]KGM11137.1 trehalose phosphatase [Cellulomonas carbonis T26]GGC05239.1 bifunctional alpha,alpha-trehalose-phosphate synthase (UDP-forming)/trehalose-phosphatase [Cellulomonas carbonis]